MDYHILEMRPAQDGVRVAFHVPVPDQNNAAGYSYRTAIVEWLKRQNESGEVESEVPNLDTAVHDLDDGSVIEFVENVRFDGNLADAAKRTAIEAAYTARKTYLLQAASKRLEFWSWAGDVA